MCYAISREAPIYLFIIFLIVKAQFYDLKRWKDLYLVASDSADVSTGHFPPDTECSAVHRLQLNVQRWTQPL